MLEIKLDITCANKTIIYFGSRILLSLIDTVQLLISISTANFYVINILILFFFCLKDIDVFGIYLNNITN